jgi:hypothetical protein
MYGNLPRQHDRHGHSRHARLRPHGRTGPLVRTAQNPIRDLRPASHRRPSNRNPNRNNTSFKKGPKAMKTNAERISNRNTNRYFGAAVAVSNHRTSGETAHALRSRNKLPLPGFVVGALEPLRYTSRPVLGNLLAVALSVAGSKGGLGFYIHRTVFLALINAGSHGADCTTSRWRSNHATQKIQPCLKRARSLHRARLRPQHHPRHRTQNQVRHHAEHCMRATRTLRWWAGRLLVC